MLLLLLLLLLLLQHVPLAEVRLQIGLHLIETNAAPTEEIGCGVLPVSIVHRQMWAMLAGGGVAHQRGSRQMTISLLIMMVQLLLLLLMLLLRFAYEKYYNSRDGSRRGAYVIARPSVFKGVII